MIVSTFEGWLTASEAAEAIGVSHSTITRYVEKGQIPYKRVGQNILIPKEAAENFERPKRGNPAFSKGKPASEKTSA
jgi:excisionase family DNA binding protein